MPGDDNHPPAGGVSDFEDGFANITVPSNQTFVDGSCDPAAYILLGKTNTPRLTFSPVMGFVSLKSTAPASGTRYIKSVTLEPVGGEKMSGVFNTTNYYTAITGGTISGITISAGEGNTIPFGKTIVFAVPKGTYASGVRFKIVAIFDRHKGISTRRTSKPGLYGQEHWEYGGY